MKRLYLPMVLCGLTAFAGTAQTELRAELPRRAVERVDKLGNSKWDNADGHDLREVDTEGEMKVLVLLVDFQDVSFVHSNPVETIGNLLNQPGYNANGADGSAYDYFTAVSFGQFSPKFEIYGPVKLSKTEAEYVSNDETYTDANGKEQAVYAPGRMIEEACLKLDDVVNFADYDANGDGMVDFVYVFHAGKGATTGGNTSTTIWPHAYTLTAAIGAPIELDGVKVNRYATSCEVKSNNKVTGIGMFVHEFCHVLGLPDLYDTSNNGSVTSVFSPGPFSCMDAGNYNNNADTPPVFSAYERYSLEWMLPTTISGSAEVTMLPLEARNFAYKVDTKSNPQEYFLLESRAKHGWDYYLPSHGLAIWHIDFNESIWADNKPNNVASHQRIDLIEADDMQESGTRSGDLFPGSATVCEFNPYASPAFLDWKRQSTGYSIERIRRYPDGAVAFSVVADNGRVMEGMEIAAPANLRIAAAGEDEVTLAWDACAGAEAYSVCVYQPATDGSFEAAAFLPGWFFKNVNGTEAVVAGLESGKHYEATVYALGAQNAARCLAPVSFTGNDQLPQLTALAGNSDALLQWSDLAIADAYEVTLGADPVRNISSTESCGFEGSKLPEGWTAQNGGFETGKNYVCEGSVSYRLSGNNSFLQTPVGKGDVLTLSFWHRQRFDEAFGQVDIYGLDHNGNATLLHSLTELPDNSQGGRVELNIQPGFVAVRIAYTTLTTGLDWMIDDVKVGYGEFSFTPLETVRVEGSDYHATGLENGKEYAACVVALTRSADEMEHASRIVTFTPSENNTGADSVIADTFQPQLQGDTISCQGRAFRLYSVDGRLVASSQGEEVRLPARGLYIVVCAERSAKVVY